LYEIGKEDYSKNKNKPLNPKELIDKKREGRIAVSKKWFLAPDGQSNKALRLCLPNFKMASTYDKSIIFGPCSGFAFSVRH
jgi:membrane-bound lytic murein transglycosylase B